MEDRCGNCGVPIVESAASSNRDNIVAAEQERYTTDGGIWCEACYFRENGSGLTGLAIASKKLERSASVDELISRLKNSHTVDELRTKTSIYGISLPRGATKHNIASKIVTTQPVKAAKWTLEL